jgi:hypothetical protein
MSGYGIARGELGVEALRGSNLAPRGILPVRCGMVVGVRFRIVMAGCKNKGISLHIPMISFSSLLRGSKRHAMEVTCMNV